MSTPRPGPRGPTVSLVRLRTGLLGGRVGRMCPLWRGRARRRRVGGQSRLSREIRDWVLVRACGGAGVPVPVPVRGVRGVARWKGRLERRAGGPGRSAAARERGADGSGREGRGNGILGRGQAPGSRRELG